MSKCNKYRIKEFSLHGTTVYCAQKKFLRYFWKAMYYEGKGFDALHYIPYHVNTKEKALKIIEDDRAAIKAEEARKNNWEKHKKEFGKPKYYCVDEERA